MIEPRPFASLGHYQNEWLDAHHHFSFAEYHDPARMGLGLLRVWNDDAIAPHTGFPPHSHRDMEIVTFIRQGAISHEDGLGNKGRTAAGDVQVMSAGTGITHAEYNHEDETTRIFQIWIHPNRKNLPPRWEQRQFPQADRHNRFVTLASGRKGDEGALSISQDAALLAAVLDSGKTLEHHLGTTRQAYLVVANGAVEIEGTKLNARDGAVIRDSDIVSIKALADSEVLLVDLP